MATRALPLVRDDRDWLTLFNGSWWRPAQYAGAWIPPRSWRILPVAREPYYVIPSPLEILHCEPLEPMTARVQRELTHRRARLLDAETPRLEQIYLRHDLAVLEGLISPWGQP